MFQEFSRNAPKSMFISNLTGLQLFPFSNLYLLALTGSGLIRKIFMLSSLILNYFLETCMYLYLTKRPNASEIRSLSGFHRPAIDKVEKLA